MMNHHLIFFENIAEIMISRIKESISNRFQSLFFTEFTTHVINKSFNPNRPPTPNFGGAEPSKSPRIGEFRGRFAEDFSLFQ